MRPIRVTVTGVGNSVPIPLDRYAVPQNTGLVVVVTGTVDYTVQHTFDDVFDENFNPATANWIDHPVLQNLTVTQDSNYAFPPEATRIVVNSGTGTVVFTVIQASGGQA